MAPPPAWGPRGARMAPDAGRGHRLGHDQRRGAAGPHARLRGHGGRGLHRSDYGRERCGRSRGLLLPARARRHRGHGLAGRRGVAGGYAGGAAEGRGHSTGARGGAPGDRARQPAGP
eukprot:4127778-Pleurochrysis_carterae.AAC.1